ncbi:hypothetical protein [Curtobacterium oceanosedimentum]|uniref:hypothetical protein n=1 Tax=Curtobacterium oceanosedimentum TaxID=465820 RepID=UPI0033964EA4
MSALTATQYELQQLTLAPEAATRVTVTITLPAPSTQTVVISASSASAQPNVWTAWFTPLLSGVYNVAWTDQAGNVLETDTLAVSAPVVGSLLSIEECYLTLSLPTTMLNQDADTDADMLVYAAAATSVIEGIVGPVVPRTIEETFDGGALSVALGARPTTLLAVSENGVPITDFLLDEGAGILRAGTEWWNRPFWPGQQNVRVTYIAGTGNPPANVRLACREEFRFLWQIGRQGGRSSMSSGVSADVSVPSGFGIPNRVYELLSTADSLPGFA